ncbi:hypothetical protein FACS1894105_11200 [Clostridia bacterium]|nr:hypothetical protein FACS1894105_11200 [Clostridia bacterium]
MTLFPRSGIDKCTLTRFTLFCINYTFINAIHFIRPTYNVYAQFLGEGKAPGTFASYIESVKDRAAKSLQRILDMYDDIG